MITPKGFVLLGSMRMITQKGFVLLGSIERERTRASCCWGARAGACERGRTQSTKANQPAGPLARASGSWYRVEYYIELSCSVVSSLSLLWTMCMCWRAHKVSTRSVEHSGKGRQ